MTKKSNVLPETARLAKYTRQYFTKRNIPEIQSWHKRIIRTDIASCLCYALGNPKVEAMRQLSGEPFREHLAQIVAGSTREPNLVVDLGTGRGEIPALLSIVGIKAVGVDPSPGAVSLFPKTMLEWANKKDFLFYNLNSYLGMCEIMGSGVDTVIMCESIEHIREEEFADTWPLICEALTETRGLFIVTNMMKKHPIPRDGSGYDHIRRIDDELYDELAKDAKRALVRKGSHMVLQF